jgi:hypothetical protein
MYQAAADAFGAIGEREWANFSKAPSAIIMWLQTPALMRLQWIARVYIYLYLLMVYI